MLAQAKPTFKIMDHRDAAADALLLTRDGIGMNVNGKVMSDYRDRLWFGWEDEEGKPILDENGERKC